MIDSSTGEALGSGKNGEILVKSPLVMIGYAGNPTATAAIIDKDGWLHTGRPTARTCLLLSRDANKQTKQTELGL